MRIVLAIPLLLCVTMGAALGDDPPGIEVGKSAPAFSLKNQHGQPTTLAELLKKGNVALVFYRSADW